MSLKNRFSYKSLLFLYSDIVWLLVKMVYYYHFAFKTGLISLSLRYGTYSGKGGFGFVWTLRCIL